MGHTGTDAWIVESKLSAPKAPEGWLSRELLPPGPLPSVVALVAGAGYGKSLGALSLVAPLQEAGVPVLWYTLDPYDADPATFFGYLVAGLRQHVPQLGEEVKALLSGGRLEPRLLWQALFQSIASFNLPQVVVVLDEVHHLQEGSPELVKALAYFFDKLPPGLHLILASRRRLNSPTSKAQSAGKLVLLGPDRLRFSSAEEVAFMRARAPEGGIPNGWWKAATGLDGWPLGLELVTAGGEGLGGRLEGEGVEHLSAYVAEELYGAQVPERRAFMLRASLLPELSAEACREVFRIPDAAELLDALEADFLVRRMGSGAGYRLPAYLRDFLLAEAERALDLPTRRGYHERAAAYHEAQGAPELALPHRIAAQDWPGAIRHCADIFPSLRFGGRFAQIARWLEAFPAELLAEEPFLQLWRGHTLSRTGAHVEALPCYERARQGYGARQDALGSYKVQVRLATLQLIHHERREGALALLEALGQGPVGADEDLADWHLAQAMAFEQRGDLAGMRAHNEAVLRLPIGRNVELAASHVIALLNLHTQNVHLGAFGTAKQQVERAIELAEAWAFYPYKIFAGFLLANLNVIVGNLEAVGAFLKGLEANWTELMDWHDLACAYAIMGSYHQAKAEWKEAEELLRRSQLTFDKAGFDEGTKVALERLLWLVVARRQPARAAELAQEVPAGAGNLYDLLLLPPRARALHLLGQPEGALALLREAIPGLEKHGAQVHLARAHLLAAASALAVPTEGEAAARAHLSQALPMAAAQDHIFLITQDAQLWGELAHAVARLGLALDFVNQALSKAAGHRVDLRAQLGLPAGTAPLAPLGSAAGTGPLLGTGPLAGGADQAAGTAPLGQGLLSVRVLGGFEVRLDGALLDHWPRRKAKLILAALLLYPRGLTLAQLAEFLGPEEVSAGALTTLKVDVSALRRVLEPNMAKGGHSSYVMTEDDRYVLAWPRIEFFDLRAVEQKLSEGDRLRDAEPDQALQAYEAALEHHRGNLLEDSFFGKFFEAEREARRRKVVAVLLWMAEHQGHQGKLAAAESLLQRAVELAPTEEEIYVQLMHHQKRVGRPERIRQVYWDCRKALKSHLGLTPSPEFEAAYEAIAKA